MAAPIFSDVKHILDTLIANWAAGKGRPADLLDVHNTQAFGWSTRDELLASVGRGKRLIQPDIIGKPKLGATANLVIDLTKGLPGFPKMPLGGLDSKNNLYLAPDSPEIATIIAWIEAGCHDDPLVPAKPAAKHKS